MLYVIQVQDIMDGDLDDLIATYLRCNKDGKKLQPQSQMQFDDL